MEIHKKLKLNMRIFLEKITIMGIGRNTSYHTMQLDNVNLQQTQSFKYLGTVVAEVGRIEKQLKETLTTGGKLFNNIKHTFLGKKEIRNKRKFTNNSYM